MKKIFLIILSLIIYSSASFAGDVARKGTTGAEQLLVPVGARGIATGGAMLASLTGLESIYYNPAGLALNEKTEIMFSYMNYLADINVSYFAAATSFGDFGSVGLTFKSFDFGKIPVTTVDFPDGTGSTYSPSFITLGLTYSIVLTDRIAVGTNLKVVSETINNTSANGVAIDFGVLYHFTGQFSMAAALKNIGTNMSYSGTDLQQKTTVPGTVMGSGNGAYEVVSETFQIPSYFELSLAYDYMINDQNSILLGSTYTANNAYEDKLNLGMEYGFADMFFIRGGYNMMMENTDQNVFGFTAGAGFNYGFSDGMGLSFDYAFRDVKEFPQPNHVFTVKLSLQ